MLVFYSLYYVGFVPSSPVSFSTFTMKDIAFCKRPFLHLLRWSYDLGLQIIYVIYYINIITLCVVSSTISGSLEIKPTWFRWQKPFEYMLVSSKCFTENFCTCSLGIWACILFYLLCLYLVCSLEWYSVRTGQQVLWRNGGGDFNWERRRKCNLAERERERKDTKAI